MTQTMTAPEYSDQLADVICTRLSEGESLRSICRDETMPKIGTIMRWLGLHPAFAEQYARAREVQADTHADEIIDVADDVTSDPDASSRRVRVEARKWVAAKLKPKSYGDKTEITHAGAIALDVNLSGLNPDQLRLLASIPLTGE